MINWNGTNFSPVVISASEGVVCIPWIATARDFDGASLPYNEAARTETSCFMRGLAENVNFNTNDSTPWEIRCIAFTYKGLALTQDPGTVFYTQTSQGMVRANNRYPLSALPTLRSILFRGSTANDWADPQIAPLDNANVKVCMDYNFSVKSTNDLGTFVRKKMWHKMGHNLKYNDDERGEGTDSSFLSTPGRPGMGDYYVCFIVSSGGAPLTGSQISIEFNSTLYWHEK